MSPPPTLTEIILLANTLTRLDQARLLLHLEAQIGEVTPEDLLDDDEDNDDNKPHEQTKTTYMTVFFDPPNNTTLQQAQKHLETTIETHNLHTKDNNNIIKIVKGLWLPDPVMQTVWEFATDREIPDDVVGKLATDVSATVRADGDEEREMEVLEEMNGRLALSGEYEARREEEEEEREGRSGL